MKKLSLLLLFFSSILITCAQTKGLAIESSIYNNDDVRKVNYQRILSTGYDQEYGHSFNTLYNFFNPTGETTLQINVVNYNIKKTIEIYIFPYLHGTRLDDQMEFYVVDPNSFNSLTYIEEGESNYSNNKSNNKKSKLKIAYFSSKKENIKLIEIYTKLFDVHYQIE